jgi:NADPH:quinone reductase
MIAVGRAEADGGGSRVKAFRVHEYGDPESALRFDEVASPEPGPGELAVRVRAVTLNFNDIDGVRGRYRTVRPPLPFIPGMEVLGRVEAAGAGAEDWVGKRVCAIPRGAFGGYAERAVCPAEMAFEMPTDLPDLEAAAVYFPFHLAWLALFERGGLRSGETVLIHAAAGGVGSAALQLARHAGARVLATAGSEAKLAFCRELGAQLAIDYRSGPFVDAVLEATEGRGVDVVFDSVGGDVTVQSLRCIAFNGRLLAVGFASGIEAEDESSLTVRPLLFGNCSIVGVCHAYVADPLAFKRATGFNFPSHRSGEALHERVLALIAQGKVRPIVGRALPFSRLPEGLAAMERRETIGRTVALLD